MPLRGESIGTAYIRVLADGSGLPQSVRDEFDKADKQFDDAGGVGAKRFKKTFDEELNSHTGRSIDDAFNDALAKNDFTQEFFESDDWKKFETNMHARFGGLGTDAADELRTKFSRAGSLDGIETDVTRVVSRINSDIDDMIKESERAAEEAGRAVEDVGNALERNDRKTRTSTTLFGKLGQSIDRIGNSVGKVFGKGSRNNFLNFIGSFVSGAVKLLGLLPKILDNIGQFAKGFKGALEDGDGFFKAVSNGFTEMSKDADGAAQAGTGLFGSIGQLLISLPLLAAVVLGVASILSIVTALVANLAGAVIALAGSISFAIIGAIAPLVGLLGPLAVGLGVVAAGFLAVTKNSKVLDTLKAKFQPLLDDVEKLGDLFVNGFLHNLDVSASTLAPVLSKMDTLFRHTGEEVGTVADNLIKGFNSPEFNAFLNRVTVQVPRQLSVWSSTIQNIGGILSGLFIDLSGPVFKFDNAVESITQTFDDWINSTQGKQEVLRFLREAGDSAQTVGKLLLAASQNLGLLLSGGKATGDDIFVSLTKQIQKFTDFISPKGGKTVFDEQAGGIKQIATSADGLPKTNPLDTFFKNSETTADAIGRIALGFVKIFAALDNKEGQKNLKNTLDLLDDIASLAGPIGLLSEVLPKVSEVLAGPIGIGFAAFKDPTIQFALHKIGDFFKNLPGDVGHALKSAGDKIKTFFGDLGNGGGFNLLAIRPPDISWIAGSQRAIGHFFSDIVSKGADAAHGLAGLAGRFGKAAAQWGANMLVEISRLPSEIVGFFEGLGKQIISAIGSVVIDISVKGPLALINKLGDFVTRRATGGIVNNAQLSLIGEAGAEAVVPLTGPLSNVDPSVRELSAIARGLKSGTASSVQTAPGKTINVEQHITTVAVDPLAAASEFLNYLSASVA